MKSSLVSAAIVFATLISGCATILNDENASVTVTSSSNKNIEAVLAGKQFIVPATVQVPRDGSDYVVSTQAEGCEPLTAVSRKMDTAFLGNLITGGVGGSTTDYATGEMWEYQENVVIACKN